MRFLLRATTEGEGWYGHAFVEIDAEQAQVLLGLKEAFQVAQRLSMRALPSHNGRLYQMFFWGHVGCVAFYEELDTGKFLSDDEEAYYESDEKIIVPDERLLGDALEENNADRTECDQLLVEEDGIRFYSIIRHTDLCVTTSLILFAELVELLNAASLTPAHKPSTQEVP